MVHIGKEVKLGIIVTVTIVAAFFVINFLRGKDVFNREDLYTVTYDNVDGLKPSAFVYYKGYKAGVVRSVEYDASMDVFSVVLAVRNDFSFPEDTRAEIYSSDLMGGKSVRILEGSSAKTASGTLTGSVASDPLNSVMASLPDLTHKIMSVLDTTGTLASSVNNVVLQNRENIQTILSSLSESAYSLENIAKEADGKLIPELSALACGMSSIVADSSDLKQALANFNEISAELSDAHLKDVAGEISELLKTLNSGTGTAGKLLSDEELYNRAEALLSNVDSLVSAIKSNPKKYIRVSVF